MVGRYPSRLAWSLWGLALGSAAAGLVLGVLALSAELPEGREPFLAGIIVQDVLAVLYGTLGAMIASRHPRNAIGWIFCSIAVSLGILSFAYGYADYVLYTRGGAGGVLLAGAVLAGWITNWLFVLAVFVAVCFLFLLFPDGRPASPRWRPVILVLTMVAVAATLASAFEPEIFSYPTLENPLGPEGRLGEIVSVASDVTDILAVPAFLVSIASMIWRLRRSRGTERQQLKWVAYAATLTATSFAASFVAGSLTGARAASDVFFLLGVAGFGGIPVAAGIAILRHRLYDIDRVINRTLVYTALTATLALVYLGSVVLLQTAFVFLTGQGSQLAVVASTLTIAALFVPLRRRLQGMVDRRFYRNKYDAARTLEALSARLREETDLDALSGELVNVVRETVQPERASLWLRPPAERGADG